MNAVEANIDGLVGPTHNYAGLAFGNIASEKHALTISNPKQAALQGLQKMKFLHDLGIPQMVMPPQPRPHAKIIRQLGYKDIKHVPKELLNQIYSASSMWVANAATISPSADTADGKVHITPANLVSKFHRGIEASTTAYYLKQIFKGTHFVHHDPLPSYMQFGDEGAANHMRLSKAHGDKGTEIFVYGSAATKKYPPRQSLQASQAIAYLHRLNPKSTVFLQQNPEAVDAGVFHNDVIAMSNEELFIYHELAYESVPQQLRRKYKTIVISEKELLLKDVVSTYFFNSQLVTLPEGGQIIIAPKECEKHAKARKCFEGLISKGIVKKVYYLDVHESMKNGGGPACLRLRVVLTEKERKAIHPKVWLNDALYNALCRWIKKYYRDRMLADDLRDPLLAEESFAALAELSRLIGISMEAS